MAKRKMGWMPDLPDQRDFLFKAAMSDEPKVRIPKICDISAGLGPVMNQYTSNSCVGHACVGAIEYLERTFEDERFYLGSPMYVYWNSRTFHNATNIDNGTMIRTALKGIATWGICSKTKWPYSKADVNSKPTPNCYNEGATRLIQDYLRVYGLKEIREAIYRGFPVIIGYTCYESQNTANANQTGMIPLPKADEKAIGGHCVLLVGYNDHTRLLKFRNSWGSSWGDKGHGYLPYDYFERPGLSGDNWIVRAC